MLAFILLLALASGALADEYTSVDWITFTEDGSRVILQYPGMGTMEAGCFELSGAINDNVFETHASKWQKRSGDSWITVAAIEGLIGFCGWVPEDRGEYRLAIELLVDGKEHKYASKQTLVIGGSDDADNTAIKATSWGKIKNNAN